ncbi:microcin C ABC transporter permease YejB [Paraburkholderia sp.]|uniref:microcin C ABC transporter permease YejB n=1 Tax=Paraburkholderia sp. TaxID=1926495 RepID=UPI002391019E|nr:microcin C ABC transporter permease YejB [Paraburkholderia sp.]MDE1181871.1 microcin C ABC transporter permease YejB [Paraburkholderia sp.]
MIAYILRRLCLIVPTLLAILVVNFIIVQTVPGGPVEQAVARLNGIAGGNGVLGSSAAPGDSGGSAGGAYSSNGVDPALMAQIRKRYGFDKPPLARLGSMIVSYAHFDFGTSFYLGERVIDLIREKLPVSLSLGLWSTLLTYLIAVPLGIRKALRHGSRFDVWTSTGIVVAYAVPTFLFAVMLITLFAGGLGINVFPLRGLVSDNFAQMTPWHALLDYGWHLVLPVVSLSLGTLAATAIMTKNAFLNEISRQYVVTARAKGLTERRILYRHVFRNAILLLVSGIPQTFTSVFLGGALLIEVLFSLDGFGRMSYEAAMSRDYPVVFGSLFIFTLAGMLIKLIGDLLYMLVDPRIDLSARAS